MNHPIEDTETCRPLPSLRERKCARTKHALLRAALERLREKHLDEITVKELCEDVEVCEATFFNYFRKKTDLLHYFVQVWTLEVLHHAQAAAGADSGVAFIEAIFEYTGNKLANHPRVMLELIAHMASNPHSGECQARAELSVAEMMEALPSWQDVECLPELNTPFLFRPALQRAMDRGELPAGLDIEETVLALLSVFFGVPLCLGAPSPERITAAYRHQLKLIWAGLRAAA